ncbi:hypothetical protein TanjilG_20553 [Lupinus angustifolius]|uniref:Uncharacterized protein n=1 Tax=Lupinus angustifolius TaxID=3871 RepID=A0A1J7GHF3_LUPAN|nr:hypothetical protein TanjilG_20553 [Lupinus angustifolius]
MGKHHHLPRSTQYNHFPFYIPLISRLFHTDSIVSFYTITFFLLLNYPTYNTNIAPPISPHIQTLLTRFDKIFHNP